MYIIYDCLVLLGGTVSLHSGRLTMGGDNVINYKVHRNFVFLKKSVIKYICW